VLEIGLNIAEWRWREGLVDARVGVDRGSGRDAVPPPQPVEPGTGDVGTQATAHHLKRIVERQRQARAQLNADLLLFGRKAQRPQPATDREAHSVSQVLCVGT
jgi:hypothetical protein